MESHYDINEVLDFLRKDYPMDYERVKNFNEGLYSTYITESELDDLVDYDTMSDIWCFVKPYI